MSDITFRVRSILPIISTTKDEGTIVVIPKGMAGDCHGASLLGGGVVGLHVQWQYAAVHGAGPEDQGMVSAGWEQLDVNPHHVEVA